MPVSRKRKKNSETRPNHDRQKRELYLPLTRAGADALSLQVRLAFEEVRQGRGDKEAALNMSSIVLLVKTLSEDGFGLLPSSLLDEATQGISNVLAGGLDTDKWQFSDRLVAQVNAIVNEYDRHLQETRLQAIAAAYANADRKLVRDAKKSAAAPERFVKAVSTNRSPKS